MLMNFIVLSALVAASSPHTGRVSYEGHHIVRVHAHSATERAHALEVAEEVWGEGNERDGVLELRVREEGLAALYASGMDFERLPVDLEGRAREEQTRLMHRPAPTYGSWFSDFRDYAEIDEFIDVLVELDVEHTSAFDVGDSLQGRDVRGIKIGNNTPDEPAVLLIGTQHAREWLSPMTVMCVSDRLIRARQTDPEVAALLDVVSVYVVPVVNPDGYEISWNGNRYWRKNARGGHGVDLNRNWGHEWGGPGSSGYPYSENYRGSAPFSEPETQNVRDFVEARPGFAALLDFHAYGELIIYPWGYTADHAPDHDVFVQLAGDYEAAAEAVHDHDYNALHGSQLYLTAGGLKDWGYGGAGMMSFTVEVRGDDFVVDPSEIIPTCEENYAGVLATMTWVAEQFPPSSGTGTDGTGGSGSGSDGGREGTSTGARAGSTTSGSGSSTGGSASSDDGVGTKTSGMPVTSGAPVGSSDGSASTETSTDGAGQDAATGCAIGHRSQMPLLCLFGLFARRRRQGAS